MEPESVTNHTAIPVRSSERYVILDVLRGLALLGIALANFPELAEVIVNGRSLGILWKTHFSIGVTDVQVASKNELEIRVTNLWVNRLIGEQQPEVRDKITYTTFPFFPAESPLLPSGLLGPVSILKRKWSNSVIGVITSVIHLPNDARERYNFASEKENKK